MFPYWNVVNRNVPKMATLADRLREERGRLGMNQDAMAAAAGLKRSAQIRYEKGDRSPDADYLAAVAALGVDVVYVLTGEQSRVVPAGYISVPRVMEFGRFDTPEALLFPDFLLRRKIGVTPVEDVRWLLNPTSAMEPVIEQHAVVLVDVSKSGHEAVLDGLTYAYTLSGRPDVRRILIRTDHWSVASPVKGGDYRDVYDDDMKELKVLGEVIGSL
jgi:transcriptional regulator with XRE-family HTH domain